MLLAAFAGVAAAQAVGAGPTSTTQGPTQLWEQFPLDPAPQQARAPARTTPAAGARGPRRRPPAGSTRSCGSSAARCCWAPRSSSSSAGCATASAPRPAAAQTGSLVPLTPRVPPGAGARSPRTLEPTGAEPEPGPREPVADPAPDPLADPSRSPSPNRLRRAAPQAIASTYEIVWYRQGERLVFGLQPLDGRATRAGRERSGSFRWDEDDDPPSTLRDAQRAHGRLRSRLLRDGWTPAGRGRTWFSHRFRPPER